MLLKLSYQVHLASPELTGTPDEHPLLDDAIDGRLRHLIQAIATQLPRNCQSLAFDRPNLTAIRGRCLAAGMKRLHGQSQSSSVARHYCGQLHSSRSSVHPEISAATG